MKSISRTIPKKELDTYWHDAPEYLRYIDISGPHHFINPGYHEKAFTAPVVAAYAIMDTHTDKTEHTYTRIVKINGVQACTVFFKHRGQDAIIAKLDIAYDPFKVQVAYMLTTDEMDLKNEVTYHKQPLHLTDVRQLQERDLFLLADRFYVYMERSLF